MRRIQMRRRGFTLIEIAIAIAIIAVLAITVIIGARALIGDSQESKTIEAADTMVKAYYLSMVNGVATNPTAAAPAACDGALAANGQVMRVLPGAPPVNEWQRFYPSGICTTINGNHGILGVGLGQAGIAIRINCNNPAAGSCLNIYNKLAGSYRQVVGPIGAVPCPAAPPVAATTNFTFCAALP